MGAQVQARKDALLIGLIVLQTVLACAAGLMRSMRSSLEACRHQHGFARSNFVLWVLASVSTLLAAKFVLAAFVTVGQPLWTSQHRSLGTRLRRTGRMAASAESMATAPTTLVAPRNDMAKGGAPAGSRGDPMLEGDEMDDEDFDFMEGTPEEILDEWEQDEMVQQILINFQNETLEGEKDGDKMSAATSLFASTEAVHSWRPGTDRLYSLAVL